MASMVVEDTAYLSSNEPHPRNVKMKWCFWFVLFISFLLFGVFLSLVFASVGAESGCGLLGSIWWCAIKQCNPLDSLIKIDPEVRREVRAWLTAAPTPLITELQVLRQEDPTDWKAGHTPTWLESRLETRLVFRFSEADRICEVQQASHRAELQQIFSGTILLMTCLSLCFYPLHLRSDEQNIQT